MANEKDLGKGLDDILNEVEQAETEKASKQTQSDKESFDTLNVEVYSSTAKTLRLLAAYHDKTLKEIVNEVMTKYAKREKKKMLSEMMED